MTELRSILLAEDNSRDVELVLAVLNKYKLADEVVVVRDGEQALDYLHRRGTFQSRSAGQPIAILLENKDWKNWEEALPVVAGDAAKHKEVKSPRPGHADLAGALK